MDIIGILNSNGWKHQNLEWEVLEYFFLQFLFKRVAQNYHLTFNLGCHSLAQTPKVCSIFALLFNAFSSLDRIFVNHIFQKILKSSEITKKFSEISESLKKLTIS